MTPAFVDFCPLVPLLQRPHEQSRELWDAIMLSRQIAVHAPGEIVEPKMEVVIVLE